MRELTPELRAVVDLAHAAQGAYEVEDILRRVTDSVGATFGFERVGISRYLPERNEVEPVVVRGVPQEALHDVPRSLAEQPVLQRALEARRAVFVADARKEWSLPADVIERFGITSVLAVPLITRGRCLGFLAADQAGKPFTLDRSQIDLLTTIGTIAAILLEKAIAHDELRRVDELKSNFIALASHELRTPAAVIHGIASTMHMRGDALTDDQVRMLQNALYEQTERMRHLVDQLLDLSRLEADAARIVPERVPVLSRLQELVRSVAAERAPDVTVTVAPELEALVDPTAFDRIVANLLVNAASYGAPPIEISAEQRDRHFRLRVRDHGRGVPPEFVPQLFERFTRSRTSIQDRAEGAGLGLAIAKSYAQAHGGDLLYEDARPHGARFELVLPVQPRNGEASENEATYR